MTVARSGRFAGERAPAFVALNSSLALDWRLWPEDIEGSVAHARALRGAGILSAAELEAIEDGLAAVGREIESGAFVPADADEDVHMAIERRLTELIGDAGARLHTGRSRNDQVVTDVRLHLRRVVERQDAALAALQELLARAGGRPRRDGAAGVHAPAARPGHVAGAAPAGVLLDARARPLAARGRPAGLPRAAARGRRRGRPRLRSRPRGRGGRPRLRARRRELARRGRRPRLRRRLPRRRGAARRAHLAARRRARPVGERRVRLRAPAGRLRRRLEHHAAEEEPGRRRADAGRRSAADRRPRRPPRRAPRPAARLQHRPARGQALPVRRRRLPRPAAAGRARAARGGHLRRGAHGGGLRPLPGRHRRRRLPRREGRAVPRGAPPHRRPGAPLPGARARTSRRCRSRTCGRSRRRSTTGYYALHEPAAQLARKRSRGGSAPARVREQLERARAALAARPCC